MLISSSVSCETVAPPSECKHLHHSQCYSKTTSLKNDENLCMEPVVVQCARWYCAYISSIVFTL